MMKIKPFLLTIAATLALAACSKEDIGAEPGAAPGSQSGEIRFEIGFAPQTRVATDNAFKSTWEDGDAIGIFAVAHGTPLAAAGNPIHNVKLTYSSAGGGKWSGAAYWPASSAGISRLDFYAYHPYDANGGSPATLNPTAIAFNVAPDQSAPADAADNTPSGFARSHLLMAKAADGGADGKGFAKGETVRLTFRHALAMVQVSAGVNMPGKHTVYLDGCATDAVLNLATQQTSPPATDPQRITMYPCPDDGDGATATFAYRALVPVQTVARGTALFRFESTATDPLTSPPLTADVTLTAGQAETFGFSAPYVSVTVSATERIAGLLTTAELAAITHLKVYGEMDFEDFYTIRDGMPALTILDLGGATVEGNEIPDGALKDKSELKEFVFPRNITAIGASAFEKCGDLSGSLTIPAGVTTIGDGAFESCGSFDDNLFIPASVATIGDYAFMKCYGFGSLTISEGVTTIGTSAFRGCIGLGGDLTIPGSVTMIGDYAFNGSFNLNRGHGTLTISEGVTTIGESAFENCTGFTGDLTIPGSVTTIGESAFRSCTGFTGSLTISRSVTTTGEGARTIGAGAFVGCSGFKGSLTISEGVTTIGESAFQNCEGFTGSLTLPGSVTTIGAFAFNSCSGFKGSLTIPAGITTISADAFGGCGGFTQLIIPASVKTIGTRAFMGCIGFKGTLTIPAGVTEIGLHAFNTCNGFTGSLTIPASVTTISAGAFQSCSSLTGLTISKGVKTIGQNAFYNCHGLTDLTIPASVTTINRGAFKDCSSLSSITCHISDPTRVTYGEYVFTEVPRNIPLYVPAASMDAYRNHGDWSKFNIQPIPQP